MALKKQHAYPTYSKNPMIYSGAPISSPDVSGVPGGVPAGIPPYSGIGPDLNDPNSYPQSWDPQVAQMFANGLIPQHNPNLIPSPGMRIGPLRLSGSGLDAASLAVLSALQNSPRPQGFGQSFAAGLAGGLAQGRFNQAQGRAAANQSAMDAAAQDEKDRKAAAREYAMGLAQHRWAMQKNPAAKTMFRLTPAEAKAMGEGYDVNTDYPQTIKDEAMLRLRPKEPKPTRDPAEFSDLVETNAFGDKYLNSAKLVGMSPDARDAAMKQAKISGAKFVTGPDAEALGNVDSAVLNIGDLERLIDGLLPRDAAGRVTAGPNNAISAFFQTNDDLASWGSQRGRAIQMLRAAAGSKGLRINQAEILYSVANDIPKITDTYGTGMKKLASVKQQVHRVAQSILSSNRQKLIQDEGDARAKEAQAVRDAVVGK